MLQAQLRWAVRLALEAILQAEVDAFIGALPYERSPARRDRRNGTYTRSLETSVGCIADLSVPRTRQGHRTHLFERYARRREELDEAISAMFIGGVSTRGVGTVIAHLTGSAPSPSTVSRVFHTLEAEYQAWKQRSLAERYQYGFADGTYFTVMYAQEGCKMPILAVVGIGMDGQREVLGFGVGDRENQAAWEQLFEDLKRRGVKEVGLLISDGHQAMLNALAAKFPSIPRQRCIKHKMENVLGYLPKKQREVVGQELKAIFYQDSREEAEQAVAAFCAKYERDYPSAVECLQRDLEACLTFYAFPRSHWKAIRTTNIIERLFEEVKRRSHKMGAAFRNEGSCLLMFYAVVRGLRFQRLTMPAEIPAPAILHST
jgi:transposase-like protein